MASEYLKWKYRDVKPDEKPELTPRQKRANWWYYNKWYLLLGAVIIVSAGYLVARALGLWETAPDYEMAYVGTAYLPEDTVAALEVSLSELGTDCNGDGQVVFQVNQYVIGAGTDSDDALYSYADSTKLMADLNSCDSYFFLLEDPEQFQKDYQILCRLDGNNPTDFEHDIESCYLLWTECPALQSLALGQYTELVLEQEFSGDSQELLSNLALARRGFWTEKTARYSDQCDELWTEITKEASS